jgi:hypothetical protein
MPLVFLFITLILFLQISLTTFSNPGILPRIRFYPNQPHKVKIKVVQRGIVKVFRNCETCNIVKPPRSNHCHDCNNCVERFDHHCPWIGQCVAARNYRKFFLFITLANFHSIFLLSISVFKFDTILANYKDKVKNSSQHALGENAISLYLIIYELLAMLFLLSLISYHIYLVFINSTTRESLKKMFPLPYGNTYDLSRYFNFSVLNNCLNLLFSTKIPVERVFYSQTKVENILKEDKNSDDDERTKFKKKEDDDSPYKGSNRNVTKDVERNNNYDLPKFNIDNNHNNEEISRLDMIIKETKPEDTIKNNFSINDIAKQSARNKNYNEKKFYENFENTDITSKTKVNFDENSFLHSKQTNDAFSVNKGGNHDYSTVQNKEIARIISNNVYNTYNHVQNFNKSQDMSNSIDLKVIDDSSIVIDRKIQNSQIKNFYHN